MKKEIDAVIRAYERYEGHFDVLDKKIKEICEFEGGLTYCAGDGHLVINDGTSSVASLACLLGHSKRNKLSEEEHLKYCI